MVKRSQRRSLAEYFLGKGLSERISASLVGMTQTGLQYKIKQKNDDEVIAEMNRIAEGPTYRFRYRIFHDFVRKAGIIVNHKRLFRIYTEMGMTLKRKRRRIRKTYRTCLLPASEPNQRWSMDFISDQLGNGRRFRILNIIDDCTKELVWIEARTSYTGERVAEVMGFLELLRGLPQQIVSDNGTEYTSKALFKWMHNKPCQHHFIDPGKPTQNAFVESFNSILRENVLNENIWDTIEQVQESLDEWQQFYNEVRPHGSLGRLTPLEYTAIFNKDLTLGLTK